MNLLQKELNGRKWPSKEFIRSEICFIPAWYQWGKNTISLFTVKNRLFQIGCERTSFQMIILPFSDADKRGRDSTHPAFSCKEILDSGHSKGDGEYWIDPEKSGNPLKVYCDMSRSGGKRMNCFFETRGLQQEYIWLGRVVIGTFWSWLFLLSLPRSLLCFESKLQQNSRKWLVIISRPI